MIPGEENMKAAPEWPKMLEMARARVRVVRYGALQLESSAEILAMEYMLVHQEGRLAGMLLVSKDKGHA